MKTIWKFQLELTEAQQIWLPNSAEILCVQMQGRTPCLWASLDSQAETWPWMIYLVGTGQPIPEVKGLNYIGTVQMGQFSQFVWHVFTNKEKNHE
jgi:hypothetical protein